MLASLSNINLQQVASNVIKNGFSDDSDFQEVAHQIVVKGMESSEDVINCTNLAVSLSTVISEPAVDMTPVAQPLGGDTGPGKAFRLALTGRVLDLLEDVIAAVECAASLPTLHPKYVQAKARLMSCTDLFCSLVNWKLLRDTALNYCLKRLLTYPTNRQLSPVHVEAAALILQAVEPWMELNWGLTSHRYLDAYYFRLQAWCEHQMLLSRLPEEQSQNGALCNTCMEVVVKPRLQWLGQQRGVRANTLGLPALDVAAAMAVGKSQVPSLNKMPFYDSVDPVQPVQQFGTSERDYPASPGTPVTTPNPTHQPTLGLAQPSSITVAGQDMDPYLPVYCGQHAAPMDLAVAVDNRLAEPVLPTAFDDAGIHQPPFSAALDATTAPLAAEDSVREPTPAAVQGTTIVPVTCQSQGDITAPMLTTENDAHMPTAAQSFLEHSMDAGDAATSITEPSCSTAASSAIVYTAAVPEDGATCSPPVTDALIGHSTSPALTTSKDDYLPITMTSPATRIEGCTADAVMAEPAMAQAVTNTPALSPTPSSVADPQTATDSDDMTMDSRSDSGSSVSRLSTYAPRSQATTFDDTNSDRDTPRAADTNPTFSTGGVGSSKLHQQTQVKEVCEVLHTEDTAAPLEEASRVGLGHAEPTQRLDIAQAALNATSTSSQAESGAQSDAEVFHPRPDTDARSDTLSDAHPRGTPRLDPPAPQSDPAPQPFSLCEIVDRALQEYMLSHDSADFARTMQALLGSHTASEVVEQVILVACAKLEKVTWARELLQGPSVLPKSRKALKKYMEEQRDWLFCKGGIIDRSALDNQDCQQPKTASRYPGYRSRLGFQIHPSNPGYQIMAQLGWSEGKGLGANLQGRTEPCLPAFQPLNREEKTQGLGCLRYKGILYGEAAAEQLKGIIIHLCLAEGSSFGSQAVQEGLQAFLTNTPPVNTPSVPHLPSKVLCWVGALLGALTAKDRLTNDQANSLIATAVNATVNAGSVRRSAKQQLTDDVRSAMAQQTEASRRSEVQAKKAKQKNAEQLADLHRPKAPSKKTTYVTGAEGKTFKIKVKQYGGSAPTAPPSNGRVSWE